MMQNLEEQKSQAIANNDINMVNDIEEALNSLKLVLHYRGNVYSGPKHFCANCGSVVGSLQNVAHQQLGHIIYTQSMPYPGFLTERTDEGLFMPALFNKMGPRYNISIAKAMEATEATNVNNELVSVQYIGLK